MPVLMYWVGWDATQWQLAIVIELTLNLEWNQVLTWTGEQDALDNNVGTQLYCRLGGSAATDSESVRELHLIGDLLCPQSSHLSCGCQTQQIEEAGTEISHISRSLNEEWEGKPREKENYLSEWGLDSVYWKAEVPAF